MCGCIGVVAALESGTVAEAAVELTSALASLSEKIEGEEQAGGSEVAAAMCGEVVAAERAIVGKGGEERGERLALLLGDSDGCRTEAAGNARKRAGEQQSCVIV